MYIQNTSLILFSELTFSYIIRCSYTLSNLKVVIQLIICFNRWKELKFLDSYLDVSFEIRGECSGAYQAIMNYLFFARQKCN